MEPYTLDAINNAKDMLSKLKLKNTISNIPEVNIICDGHALAYYIASATSMLRGENSYMNINLILNSKKRNVEIENNLEGFFDECEYIRFFENFDEYENFYNSKASEDEQYRECVEGHSNKFIIITNLKNKQYEDVQQQDEWIRQLEDILNFASSNSINCVFPVTLLPNIPTLPGEIEGISEREWEPLFSTYDEHSLERFVVRIEDTCRKYCDNLSVKGVRIDNILGPGVAETEELPIKSWVRLMVDEGKINVPKNARNTYYSAIYITDAIVRTWAVLIKGRPGNIYHITSMNFSLFDACSELYRLFPDLDIEMNVAPGNGPKEYHLINAKKFQLVSISMKKTPALGLSMALFYTALHYMEDYENYKYKTYDVYYGKMNRIRQMELELILHVDEICRKHNIKYFLTAGSMLGAVRHGGFIPWDDDMDIGMLPEDYKRFVEIAPKELKPQYSYQTTDLEPASLYIHDKIRIKGTCFSTRYSNRFPMQNGVYIDIFVYYKTSDNPKKQIRHLNWISKMRGLMGIRWFNTPRKNHHYLFSVIFLPIMRKLGTPFYRHMYIRLLSKYEKKNTHYMIDGTGFNLKKVGAFPAEWFEGDVVYKKFEGHDLPVLAHYDDFLKHWYGENYMQLLPISKRKSVHDVIRIDLGDYIVDGVDKQNMHEIDFRGEFYEKRRNEI